MFSGFIIPYPYLSLQALSLGLTLEEVSVINAVVPFISLPASPLAGLVGDNFGYRSVLVSAMTVLCAASTSFLYVPITGTGHTPRALLVASGGTSYSLVSATWPLCSSDERLKKGACQAYESSGALDHVASFLACNFTVTEDYKLQVMKTIETLDGTFCHATNAVLEEGSAEKIYFSCEIDGHPELQPCRGSWRATFYSYLVAKTVYQGAMNVVFGVLDGVTMRLAKQHGSDFSAVAVWTQLATAAGALVPAFILEDGETGTDSSL